MESFFILHVKLVLVNTIFNASSITILKSPELVYQLVEYVLYIRFSSINDFELSKYFVITLKGYFSDSKIKYIPFSQLS